MTALLQAFPRECRVVETEPGDHGVVTRCGHHDARNDYLLAAAAFPRIGAILVEDKLHHSFLEFQQKSGHKPRLYIGRLGQGHFKRGTSSAPHSRLPNASSLNGSGENLPNYRSARKAQLRNLRGLHPKNFKHGERQDARAHLAKEDA